MKRFLSVGCLLGVFLFSLLRAQAQDEQYLRIYNLMQSGDSLRDAAQPTAAYAKYVEAQNLLEQFRKTFPDWNVNVVKYRLEYLATNIQKISAANPKLTVGKSGAEAPLVTPLPSKTTPEETARQLSALKNQIQQLENDNSQLEAKLKEALRIQPAAVDPRTVARAEQEVRSLRKENDLLKVSLAERPPPAATPDPKVVDQLKKQADEANRKASDEAARANKLAADKAELEKKIASIPAENWTATNFADTQKALDETNRRLAEQMGLTQQLSLEKTALQSRVKTLMTENEALGALRAENEILKRQVAEIQALPTPTNSSSELLEARAQIAALQSERDLLRQQKASLETQLSQPAPVSAVASAPIPVVAAADSARVQQLERERADLQKQLDDAQKEIYGRNGKGAAARVDELNGQIDILRTRLGVMEAQKIPYTAEELALFDKPVVRVSDPNVGKKSSRTLPSGSMALVSEAQKDFAARRFDQAEEKYQQVLKMDEKNVYTLANLAAIQLEQNRLDEAEKNISQALAIAPEDAYSLSLLGFLKFRQNQFDAALDALGRAAKLDPQNAEVQNYLGLTLSQKGMRDAAESALRKAITLNPSYASAHYNLAVIYVTQKPPQTALAALHYKKALAAGMAPNADMEKMLNPGKLSEATP